MLRALAARVLGDELARRIWGRVEIIGDIAVIRKPFDLDVEVLKPLAEEILKELPYVRSVWAAASPIEGPHRVRRYVHLAGEERSMTLYREHGCVFKVDITKTYISPALNYEHGRIAGLVREGEFVINMFAGVGLFTIIIAKKSRPSKVVSIDINPYAYELMKENVSLNKVEDIVEPVLGDAGEVVERYVGMADRVLMPLPELAMSYLPKAIKSLRGKGYVHVYEFITATSKEEALRKARESYEQRLKEIGADGRVEFGRIVRTVGPRYYQVVLDIKISRSPYSSSAS